MKFIHFSDARTVHEFNLGSICNKGGKSRFPKSTEQSATVNLQAHRGSARTKRVNFFDFLDNNEFE